MTCDRLEREDMLAYLGEAMDPHIDACPDCRATRAEYQRIAAALAQESVRAVPKGWMEALQSKLIAKSVASSSPRLPRLDEAQRLPPALAPREPPRPTRRGRGAGRRTRWCAGGGAVLVAAAATSLFLVRARRDPALIVQVEKGPVQYRGAEEEKHTGDLLHVKALAGDADRFELRIYLDGTRLVFQCPGESPPDCRPTEEGVAVTYALPVPGRYEVIWLHADAAIAAPVGSLDADVAAARAAGAHAESGTPIDVD